MLRKSQNQRQERGTYWYMTMTLCTSSACACLYWTNVLIQDFKVIAGVSRSCMYSICPIAHVHAAELDGPPGDRRGADGVARQDDGELCGRGASSGHGDHGPDSDRGGPLWCATLPAPFPIMYSCHDDFTRILAFRIPAHVIRIFVRTGSSKLDV